MIAALTNGSASGKTDWSDGSLCDLCSSVSDQCDPAKTDHKIYVGLEHINSGAFTISRHGSPKEVVSAKNRFKQNDILYGKLRPYLDKAVLAQQEGICSTDILVFRPRENTCPLFILALIHSKPFTEYAVQTTHGVNHPRTSWAALKDFQCSIPSFAEQEKIAAVLWKIQKAVEIEDAIVRNARDLKKSLLRRLFSHGLRGEPLKETEIGPLPESWQVRNLADVATLERGRFMHRPRNEPRFYGGDTPFVQTGDVVRSGGRIRNYSQTLNKEGVKISRIFPAGTILITIAANIGYSGILEFDSACPDSLIGITPHESVDGEYLLYYLQTQQSRMDLLAPRGTQKNINIQFLRPWPVALPPKSEQREIANTLQTVDRKIDIHESKKRSLQDLFKTMLHKLMTAQIRVDHLNIATSEVQA